MARLARNVLTAASLAVLLTACTQKGSGAAPPAAAEPTGQAAASVRPAQSWWRPHRGVTWQWQLSGTVNTDVSAQVFDVDLFTTPASTVRTLHAKGTKVLCYLDAGSWEPGRPDSAAFPSRVRGRPLIGFEDERWFDVRRTDVLLPLIARRMDVCKAKGFDGVEPDNVDGFANPTGFDLTAADQLRFNRALAQLAHARGLAVALKNDLGQIPTLAPVFDLAVNEQCFEFDECDRLLPFIRADKPVLHVEYAVPPSRFCAVTKRLGLSSLAKHESLDAYRRAC